MNDNRKSFKFVGGSLLATARNILSSTQHTMFPTDHRIGDVEEVYDPQLKIYTNYDEKMKSTLNASENITNHSSFQADLLIKLHESKKEYQKLIREYKEELRQMNELINDANHENVRTVQPMLKEFYMNLKVSLSNAKNENYQLQREADQLMRDKIHLSQQISFCEKRVEELEKFVGIQGKNTLNTSHNEVDGF